MWDKNRIKEEAKKYQTKTEFNKGSRYVYEKARKLGILKEVCSHMVSPKQKWDFQSIRQEALKYSTKTDFIKACRSAYSAARRLDILEDVCEHMIPKGNLYKRCIYSICDGKDIYIGMTYDLDKRQHRRKEIIQLKAMGEYKQMTPLLEIKDAIYMEKFLISYFRNSCTLNCINKKSGGGIGPKKLNEKYL